MFHRTKITIDRRTVAAWVAAFACKVELQVVQVQ